jgi:hypothetical protein
MRCEMLGEWTYRGSHYGHTSKNKTEGVAAQVEMEEATGEDEQEEGEIQMPNRYLHRRLSR